MTKKYSTNKILKSSKIKYHCRPHLGLVLIFSAGHFLCQVEGSFKSHVLPQERLLWIQLVLLNEPMRMRRL